VQTGKQMMSVIALLAFLFLSVAYGCKSDEDCMLSGHCVSSVCQCFQGWVGADCAQIHQNPVPLDSHGNISSGYSHPRYSSWGAGVLLGEDNLYHMFVAQFTNGCPLSSWTSNSFVMHATAANPMGPFVPKEEVLKVFHHGPMISRAPDGTFLLVSIGADWNGTQENCNNTFASFPREVLGGNTGIIGIASSKNLNGPWTLLNNGDAIIKASSSSWFTHPTNPSSPIFLSDGTVLMAFRSTDKNATERLGMLTAPSWKGPYSLLVNEPIIPGWAEDPFLWQDIAGYFHILFHAEGSNSGGHCFSRDAKKWIKGPVAYDNTFPITGGKTIKTGHRERPHLLFDDKGNPTYLYNGCTMVSDFGWSFTTAVSI